MKTNIRGHQSGDMQHGRMSQSPNPPAVYPTVGEKKNRKFGFTIRYVRYNTKNITDVSEYS